VKIVSQELGNTPAVCRKCYIHPAIIDSFSQGTLHDLIFSDADPGSVSDVVECAEDVVVRLLEKFSGKS
jgi:DNA topoisomerase-1